MKSEHHKPDGSKLSDWIKPLNLRGRWARLRPDQSRFIDPSTIHDVASAFEAEFGIKLCEIRPGSEPPDVVARIGANLVSIELTEFLKREVREKRAKRERVSWDEQQWTQVEWATEVERLLDEKEARYRRREDQFAADILLIHSCELWLSPLDVEQWLAAAVFRPRSTIRSAYFAQERLPNFAKPHWPLFRLY